MYEDQGLTPEQLAEQKRTDALIAAMRRAIAGRMSIESALHRNVSDEQLLALALSALVERGKETLKLVECTTLLAKHLKESRDEAKKNS